jgi:dolichyl-phosphate beta-glucosyltransferase
MCRGVVPTSPDEDSVRVEGCLNLPRRPRAAGQRLEDSESIWMVAGSSESKPQSDVGIAARWASVLDITDQTISLVIPAYDEEVCIGQTVGEVMDYAAVHPALREVIVVDDGSADRTAAIVEECRRQRARDAARLMLFRHERNRGKGAAVRTGLSHATGDIVAFTDADLSSPMAEVPALVGPILAGQCDIVVGSRALDRSLIAVRQSRFRETAGKIFNVLVRALTGLPIYDTQCGFKAFRRKAIGPILELQRVETFAFDVEMLYLASRMGLIIREIPVHWSHVQHTKVKLFRDSIRMFIDVLGIRLNELRGRYRWNGDSD